MEILNVTETLSHYATTLNTLEVAGAKATDAQILAVLMARDAVQQAYDAHAMQSQGELLQIIELDQKLRALAGPIAQGVSLSDWRISINPPETAWWWFLEAPSHKLDRFDWLWSAMTVASLTASASLVVDIGSKFLVGGPGVFGSFAVMSQSLITLATAGGVLTDAGRRSIDQILCSLGLRRYYWQETKFGLSLLLLTGLIGFRTALPMIAEGLTQRGQQNVVEGRLSDAKDELNRAINLDSDNFAAHYALGQVFETFEQTSDAMNQYQIALKGGYLPAYNALASLDIENERYEEAAALLTTALNRPEDEVMEDRPEVRAELLTNLGWARLNQGRLTEAEESLRASLDRQQSLAQETPEPNTLLGTTYCLLAKTVEQQTTVTNALSLWQDCQNYAQGTDPRSDGWIGQAQERLGDGGAAN